jgi:ElaB/YqjD/DUF883 family membrane-anchored ribosome-binding protein
MPATRARIVKSNFEAANDTATETIEAVKNGAETASREASELASTVVRSAGEIADTVATKLKTVGVDTDVMVTAAKDQASELQRLIGEEISNRPVRALGIAAAVGLVVGLMTSRG